MGEIQLVELNILVNEQHQGIHQPDQSKHSNQSQSILKTTNLSRWIRISVYVTFLLVGQAGATLLGRLYFTKGGKSKWLETTVQLIGFPVLIPLYYILPTKVNSDQNQVTSPNHADTSKPSSLKLGLIYVVLGIIMAVDTMFYSFGLQYLPVTTYTLICASQLAFNALFSFFLNGQNFTPYIINSLVLLTISSVLLVFQKNNDSGNPVSKGKYALGFILTVVASAGYALMLSLSQLVFRKVLKGANVKFILDMVIYESLVASCIVTIGLFASGEWRTIGGEMQGYALGSVSYVMTLVWTALLWQVYLVGVVGLIFEVSSLFSNVISTLALPITPVLAVIFLHDKMDGVKGVALVLAIWGFVSYAYEHYLDEYKTSTTPNNGSNEVYTASENESNELH